MHSPWTQRPEFRAIAGELAATQDREFERAVLPYVRSVWPAAWISPARQTWDTNGIDLIGEPSIDGTQRMRFAHRLFQEFFLAEAYHDSGGAPAGVALPDEVARWLTLFARKGRSEDA